MKVEFMLEKTLHIPSFVFVKFAIRFKCAGNLLLNYIIQH